MNRRSFLKRLGLGAAAVVAAPIITPAATAPLYIPSQRLDYGVPREFVTARAMPYVAPPGVYTRVSGYAQPMGTVPMTLLWDEFSPIGWQQFGRQKVPAGTTLMVDETTARRWIARGVAAASPNAPLVIQQEGAKRLAEKKREQASTWDSSWTWDDMQRGMKKSAPKTATQQAAIDAGWERMMAAARRDGWEVS